MSSNPFSSVDPAPPLCGEDDHSVSHLTQILMDDSASLFQRYRAMFSLRNMQTDESVIALTKGKFHSIWCGEEEESDEGEEKLGNSH